MLNPFSLKTYQIRPDDPRIPLAKRLEGRLHFGLVSIAGEGVLVQRIHRDSVKGDWVTDSRGIVALSGEIAGCVDAITEIFEADAWLFSGDEIAGLNKGAAYEINAGVVRLAPCNAILEIESAFRNKGKVSLGVFSPFGSVLFACSSIFQETLGASYVIASQNSGMFIGVGSSNTITASVILNGSSGADVARELPHAIFGGSVEVAGEIHLLGNHAEPKEEFSLFHCLATPSIASGDVSIVAQLAQHCKAKDETPTRIADFLNSGIRPVQHNVIPESELRPILPAILRPLSFFAVGCAIVMLVLSIWMEGRIRVVKRESLVKLLLDHPEAVYGESPTLEISAFAFASRVVKSDPSARIFISQSGSRFVVEVLHKTEIAFAVPKNVVVSEIDGGTSFTFAP